MDDLLTRLAECIEKGKVNRDSPFPPDMKGQDGAFELAHKALQASVPANDILKKALMVGMNSIGEKFAQGKAFIPELLVSAKAMKAAMEHLKPFFDSGEAQHRGTLIIGTVEGDLHDIGKNIVRMVLEGDGWKAVDLGVDVSVNQFLDSLEEYPDSIVGMSALLTTTMVKMEGMTKEIKQRHPNAHVFVGGAPLTAAFGKQIGADGYFPDPHSFAKYLAETKTGEEDDEGNCT